MTIPTKFNEGTCGRGHSDKCWHWKVNVPTGVYTLEEKRGVRQGITREGAHWCYCTCCGCGRYIKAQISRNTIRFFTPIHSIPTRDNVMVSLDMGINFKIGLSKETEEDDGIKFFYNFGPNRLEELLSEEVDE